MKSLFWFALAAAGEIAGCYAFWGWLRLKWSPWFIVPGTAALLIFAWALTRVEATQAGRSYASYAAVYLVGALLWMGLVEGSPPDRWDVTGAVVALVGCAIIFWGPRPA